MKFQTGTVFGNRYTLGNRIAVGGMGEVWRAADQVLGRTVAMKLLSPSLADQPGFTRRFREEARNGAMLSHPNIAAVYDYGEDSGASWLVMELVEGAPLSQIIKDDGPLGAKRTASILAQAASALQAAHDAGVIHRDVKPANILVRDDGEVKLTDFGIARAVDAAPITRTGEVMGTAQYISPEQATGKPAVPASDLYSLGVVGHEMLTGKRPFDEGSPVATAMAHIHNDPPPLPAGVGQPLAGVIMACLAKDPAQRPESAAAVASALRGGPEAAAFATTQVITPEAAATQRMAPPTAPATAPTPAAGYAQGYPQGQYPPPGYPGGYNQGTGAYQTGPMPPQQRKRRMNPLLWLLPLLLLLGLGGYFVAQSGLFGGSGDPSPTETTSPSVVNLDSAEFRGMTVEAAQARLRELGFPNTTTVEESSSEVSSGRVIAINPTGDVVAGRPITLRVSSGPTRTSAPQPTTQATTPDSTPTQAPTTDEPTEQPTAEPTEEPSPTNDNGGDQPADEPTNGGSQANDGTGTNAAPENSNSTQEQGNSGDGATGSANGGTQQAQAESQSDTRQAQSDNEADTQASGQTSEGTVTR